MVYLNLLYRTKKAETKSQVTDSITENVFSVHWLICRTVIHKLMEQLFGRLSIADSSIRNSFSKEIGPILKKAEHLLYGLTFAIGLFLVLLYSLIFFEGPSTKKNKEIHAQTVRYEPGLEKIVRTYLTTIRTHDPDGLKLSKISKNQGNDKALPGEVPIFEEDLDLDDLASPKLFMSTSPDKKAVTPSTNSSGDTKELIALANIGSMRLEEQSRTYDLPVVTASSLGDIHKLKSTSSTEQLPSYSSDQFEENYSNLRLVVYKKRGLGSVNSRVRKTYRVRSGDSLWKIANRHGISLRILLKLNPGYKNKIIHPGNILKLPFFKKQSHKPRASKKRISRKKSRSKSKKVRRHRATTRKVRKSKYYKVRRGDTLSKISNRYKVSVRNLKKRNGIKSHFIYVGQILKIKDYYKIISPQIPSHTRDFTIVKKRLFDWPVKGRITSFYGFRRDPFNSRKRQFHAGIDIGAGMRTPIQSSGVGIVIYSDRRGGYGNTVIIRHPHGYLTFYAHMAKRKVAKGDVVKKGQTIGLVGRTGNVTAAHLHFEMKKWLKPINPIPMFRRLVSIKVPKMNKSTTKNQFSSITKPKMDSSSY